MKHYYLFNLINLPIMNACCFGKTKQYYTFVKNDIPKIENNHERFLYCRSMISRYCYKKYFYVGITKNPTKKIRKLNNKHNLYYLYSFEICSFDDAYNVVNLLLDNILSNDYCLNKHKNLGKIKITRNNYYVFFALKSKLDFFY